MSKFNRTDDYKQKLDKSQKLITKGEIEKAKGILDECYDYFDSEHNIPLKLETLEYLIDIALSQNDKKIPSLFEDYEQESKILRKEITAGMYHNYGRYYSRLGDVHKSIANYRKAVKKYLLDKDPRAAISFLNLGEQFRRVGEIQEAAIAFQTSRDIFLKLNENELAMNALIALTQMLIALRGRNISVDLSQMESIVSTSRFPKSSTLAAIHINIGLIFHAIGDIDKAIAYLKKAIEISKEINYCKTYFHAHLNLGLVYIKDFKKSLRYTKKALNYFIKEGNREFIAKSYNTLATIHQINGDLDTSIIFFNKSIEAGEEIIDFELNLRNYEGLAELFRLKEDFNNSIKIYTKVLKIYKESFEKTDLLGLKQVFNEQFSRILNTLVDLNKLLQTPKLALNTEILRELEDNAMDICKKGSTIEVLETQQTNQLREEVLILKKQVRFLTTLINDKDRENLENSIIDEVCEKINSYQGVEITPSRVKEFLLQITDPILRHNFIIKIFSRIPNYFYTKESMFRCLKSIIEKLPFDIGDELIFGVLSETWNKSQNLWTYFTERSLSRDIKTEIKKTPGLLKFLLKVPNNINYYVLFLDDIIGSGKQFIKYYKKEFESKLTKYPFLDKKNIRFYLIVGIISQEAIEYISKNSIFHIDQIKYEQIIKSKDKAFYEKDWDGKLLKNLKDFLYKLDPHNWDGWKKHLINENGMEYLVIVDWRSPNNTIGILWNKTTNSSPLFPR